MRVDAIAKGAKSPAVPMVAAVHIVRVRKKVPTNSVTSFALISYSVMMCADCAGRINYFEEFDLFFGV